MKKSIAVLLTILMLFSLVSGALRENVVKADSQPILAMFHNQNPPNYSDPSNEASVKTQEISETTIFFDDFESYEAGTFPSTGGWALIWDGMGSQYQVITNTTYHSPSKSFQLWGAYGWSSVAERHFDSTARVIGFEAYMMAEGYPQSDVDGVGSVGFWNREKDTWGKYYVTVAFRSNKYLVVGFINDTGVSDYKEIQPYVPDTWYKVKVILDRSTSTFSVWINDELKVSGINTQETYDINALEVSSAWGGVRCYFDDVRVFTVEETPDFSISITPSSQSVTQGSSTTYAVTVTSLNGFNNPVSLSISSTLPSGVTYSFSPNQVTPTNSSTLTISTSTSTPANTYTITIIASGGGITHTAQVTLNVTSKFISFTPLYPSSNTDISHVMQGGTFIRYYKVVDANGIPISNAVVAYKDANSNNLLNCVTNNDGMARLLFHTDGLSTGSYSLSPIASVKKNTITYTITSSPSFPFEVDPLSYTTNWTVGNEAMGKIGAGAEISAFVKGGTSGGVTISYNKSDEKKNYSDSLNIDRDNSVSLGGGVSAEAGLGGIKAPLVEAEAKLGEAEAELLLKGFHEFDAYFDSPYNASDTEKLTQSAFLIGGAVNVLSSGNPTVALILDLLESMIGSGYIDKVSGGTGVHLEGTGDIGKFSLKVGGVGGEVNLLSFDASHDLAGLVTFYPLDNKIGFSNKISFSGSVELDKISASLGSEDTELEMDIQSLGVSAVNEIQIEYIFDAQTREFDSCTITFVSGDESKKGIEFIITKDKVQQFIGEITEITNIANFLNSNGGISISPGEAGDLLSSILEKVGKISIPYREIMFVDNEPNSINIGFSIDVFGNKVELGITPTFGQYNSYVIEEGLANQEYGLLPLAQYSDTSLPLHDPVADLPSLISEMFSPIWNAIKGVWSSITQFLSNAYDTVVNIAAKAQNTIFGVLNLVVKAGTTIITPQSQTSNASTYTQSSEQAITVLAGVPQQPSTSSSSSILPANIKAMATNEYSFIVGGIYTVQPEDGTLSQPASLSLSYTSDAIMGRDESKFKLYWFNKSDNAWEVLPSTFDPNTKTFTASITNLGQFAIGYDVTPPQYSLLYVEQTDLYYVYKTNNPDIKIKIDDSGSGVLPSSIQVKIDNVVTNYTYNSFEGVVDVNYGSTLQEGVHTLSISSTDTSGNSSSTTFNIKIEILPGKPTLSLNTVTQSSISLSWTASNPGTYPLDHYELYRAIPGKGIDFTLLATLNLNTLSYTDNDIQYPNEYIYYIVKTYDTNGNSVMSAPLVVQPVSPPNAPSNLQATTSTSSITLTWSPSTQGIYPIAGYAIYRGTSQGNESPTPIATVGSDTTTYNDTDVISGITYYYYVKAFDNENPPDYSQASNEVSAKIVHVFKITSPIGSEVFSPTDTITVSWEVAGFTGTEGKIRVLFFNDANSPYKWATVAYDLPIQNGSVTIDLSKYTISDPLRCKVRVGIYIPDSVGSKYGLWLTWTSGTQSGSYFDETGYFSVIAQ